MTVLQAERHMVVMEMDYPPSPPKTPTEERTCRMPAHYQALALYVSLRAWSSLTG